MINLPGDNGSDDWRRYHRQRLEPFVRGFVQLMGDSVVRVLNGVHRWCAATGRQPEAMLVAAIKVIALRPALVLALPDCDDDELEELADVLEKNMSPAESPEFELACRQVGEFLGQFETNEELCAAFWGDDYLGPDPSLN